MKKRIALLFAISVSLPFAAQAQVRKSPLLDAPAVRNRVEYRALRAELGVGVGAAINPTFYNAFMLNVRLGFHINDWLGLSGMGSFNLAKNVKTTLASRLTDALPLDKDPNQARTPSRPEAFASMNQLDYLFGLHLEATPFTGKFGLFGKVFANYDFYGFVGPGFAFLSAPDNDGTCDNNRCAVTGMKMGVSFGVGMHAFINKVVALDLSFRDLMFKDNPAGRDVNGDKFLNASDQNFMSHYMATFGISFYLPPDAKVY